MNIKILIWILVFIMVVTVSALVARVLWLEAGIYELR